MSAGARHRWKIAVAVAVGLVLVVDVALIRWVLKRKPRAEVAADRANRPETATTTNTAPRPAQPAVSIIPALSFDEKEGARENFDHLGHWDRNTWVRYSAVITRSNSSEHPSAGEIG